MAVSNMTLTQPYQIGGMKGPLVVPSTATKWGPAGYPQPLRTGGCQIRIAWNAGVPDFRVTALKVAFLFQNENVGVLPFGGYGQVTNTAPNWGDRFTNTGQAPPLNLPVPGDGGGSGAAAFPPNDANQGSLAFDATNGIIYTQASDFDGSTILLQAIAPF